MFKVGRNVQRLESEDIFTNNLSTSARQLSNNKSCMQYNDKLFIVSIKVYIGDCSKNILLGCLTSDTPSVTNRRFVTEGVSDV